MKKILLGIIALLLVIPMSVSANIEKAKIKVYMFYAGGCPACEATEEYLKEHYIITSGYAMHIFSSSMLIKTNLEFYYNIDIFNSELF